MTLTATNCTDTIVKYIHTQHVCIYMPQHGTHMVIWTKLYIHMYMLHNMYV